MNKNNPPASLNYNISEPNLDKFYLLAPKAFELCEEKEEKDGKELSSAKLLSTLYTHSKKAVYTYFVTDDSGKPTKQLNSEFDKQMTELIGQLLDLIDFFHTHEPDSKGFNSPVQAIIDDVNSCNGQCSIVKKFKEKVMEKTFYASDRLAKQALLAYYKRQLEQAIILLSQRKADLIKLSSKSKQEMRSEIIGNLVMLCQGLGECSEGGKSALDDIVRNLRPTSSLVSCAKSSVMLKLRR